MKLNFVRLQDFRNVNFAEIPLRADSVWVYGKNAQGKTNLLESVGLLTALRSFRTTKTNAMISQGKKCADVLVSIEHEIFGSVEIQISLAQKRKIFLNGTEIKTLSEFIGKFPALAMSSEDIRLIRGSPETRRRDIDMFISGIDAVYFKNLCTYHSALAQRNALLKMEYLDSAQLEAFEEQMAISAENVSLLRKKWLDILSQKATCLYANLAGENGEPAQMDFKANADFETKDEFLKILKESRKADAERGYTLKGPHRDDLDIYIDSKEAKTYASEGQQRSTVLSLKLAQFEIFKEASGIEPIILCDDILGELDPARRSAFWKCVPTNAQVIASSTSPAPADSARKSWRCIEVKSGEFFVKD